jgi:dihydroorotase
MSNRPAALLGLDAGTLAAGAPADLAVLDLQRPWVVSEDILHSRSHNTAFEGARLTGKVLRTIVAGRTVYQYD